MVGNIVKSNIFIQKTNKWNKNHFHIRKNVFNRRILGIDLSPFQIFVCYHFKFKTHKNFLSFTTHSDEFLRQKIVLQVNKLH